MNIEQLCEDLKVDEGVKYEIYLDHLGLPTFGIGHLIVDSDPEYQCEVGTPVSADRVQECFEKDVQQVLSDCKTLYPDFDSLPGEVQLIIANMMFNMGRPRLSKFKNMKKAVDNRDWYEAAYEMTNSKWCKQVPTRALRLVQRMQNVQT